MLFVAFLKLRSDAPPMAEGVARRAAYQPPTDVRMVAEYWLQSNDPATIVDPRDRQRNFVNGDPCFLGRHLRYHVRAGNDVGRRSGGGTGYGAAIVPVGRRTGRSSTRSASPYHNSDKPGAKQDEPQISLICVSVP